MSFRCERCHEAQPPGTRPVRAVVERRLVEHKTQHPPYEKRPGLQIAKEENRCATCAGLVTPSE